MIDNLIGNANKIFLQLQGMDKLKAFWAKQSIYGKIIWICVIINTVAICYNFYTGRFSFQGMSEGPRQKLCAVCGKDWRTMYRIKYKEGADWVFACKQCLLEVKKRNPHYKYGGTWKR